ncbi:uncharacterized protein LOC134819209 isoform X1 [Bolinopsis microptera]|uniref:uncharacterized protein LOC134819209 isoform X1 n=1 Tax=Bolinopsis microptera TaxID=2820187 RepID=UPI00307A8B03
MEGALLAFYLNDESTELEDMFKLLSKKYRDTKDLQIFAINCDEYNAPKACREMTDLPTVKHGFMGRLAKEISFTTEEQYDSHIVRLLNILAEGGHILRRNLGKIFELTISNIGEQIHRYDVSFVYYYSSACGRCPECDKVWGDIHVLYANHPLILPGRVDCNFNRGTCKQADTRGSEIAVYYKGVYHSKYSGTFKYGPIFKFLEKMYKSPPPGVFIVEPEDRYVDRKKRLTKDEEKEATVDDIPKGEKIDESSDAPERSGHALIVTSENFNYTLTNNKLVFLKFFVPWCGHCQKLKPTWKLLAQSFRDVSDIVIAMINCQNEEHLCKKHLVYGYPTMFTFIDGKQTYRYREERTLNNLIDHVKEKYYTAIEDDLKFNTKPFRISSQNVWNVLGVRKYTMVLFTAEQCNACVMNQHYFEETWKAVKSQTMLNDKLMLATVYCQIDLDLCKEMGVTQVPYIVLYDIDEKIDPGAAPSEPLLHPFLSVQSHINSSPNHLAMDVIAWQKKSNDMRAEIEEEKSRERRAVEISAKSSTPKAAPKTEAVTELGDDNFKAQLKKSRFTLVKFYAPWCGHCRKLAPIWTEIGEHYINQQDVVLAKVNCDAHEKLCDKHKVNVFPALFLFENDKKLKHACKRRKKEDIMQFVDKFLKTAPADGSAPVEPVEEPELVPEKKLNGVQGAVWQLDKEDMLMLLEDKKKDFLFVLYYYGSEKKLMYKLSDTWDRIATMYMDDKRITMGRVDCDIELNLCLRYQSNTRKDYPQLFLYDKHLNVSFECMKRGEAQLIEFIESHMEKKSKGEQAKDEL